jgi:hypothetical protein
VTLFSGFSRDPMPQSQLFSTTVSAPGRLTHTGFGSGLWRPCSQFPSSVPGSLAAFQGARVGFRYCVATGPRTDSGVMCRITL